MAEIPPERPDVIAEIRELLGRVPGGASLEALERYTRRQLLDWTQRLGITGLGKHTKEAIAHRFHQALQTLGVAPLEATAPESPPAREAPADAVRKFELGRAVDPRLPAHIPWGYGHDRVTAMVVDPERLFVYWEATDDGIERARAGLGPGGPSAWLSLRVYDVTGRIFDGTNAHGYFDQRVERTDRQWFFTINKASSTVLVELGMKSLEGYFARIARSGRAEFPRREPAPPGGVEWLTVRGEMGEVAERSDEPGPANEAPGAPAPLPSPEALAPDESWERVERTENGETAIEWRAPVVRSTWEAGPFSYPVESPRYVEEHDGGRMTVRSEGGRTRVVYGPWRVVIRGIGGHTERRVVATWELQCSWLADRGVEVRGAFRRVVDGGGGSERRLGASELYFVGASELAVGGASERMYGGASERIYGGASEVRFLGASERRLGGASETSRDGTYPAGLGDDPPAARAR
jgi:hypothetical protein